MYFYHVRPDAWFCLNIIAELIDCALICKSKLNKAMLNNDMLEKKATYIYGILANC